MIPYNPKRLEVAVAYVPQDYQLIWRLVEANERLRSLEPEPTVADPVWRLAMALTSLIHGPDASFTQYCTAMAATADEPEVGPELYNVAAASWNEVCVAVMLWDPWNPREIVFAIEGQLAQ